MLSVKIIKENCSESAKLYCKKCSKQLNAVDRIYSSVFQGYLCLPCYHNQFPKIPGKPKALFLVGYKHVTEHNLYLKNVS